MKLFKKLAVLCLSLTMCLGVGASFAACGGDDKSTTSSVVDEAIAYKFQIKRANGEVAAGYRVLLCKGEDQCGQFVAADANGIVEYPVSKLPEIDGARTAMAYDIHVLEPDVDKSDYLGLSNSTLKTTPTAFAPTTTITLTLTV